jgi:biotin synthase-like enzyme
MVPVRREPTRFSTGRSLLTTPNPGENEDLDLLRQLDLSPQQPFSDVPRPEAEAVTV